MKTKIRKQLPWQSAPNLPETRRRRPSKRHMKTASHYYPFLHHVCRPVGYTQPGRRQNHSGPIPNSPTVIPGSHVLVINIILTLRDALHSWAVKQCSLYVRGCEHSVAHENSPTPETRPLSKDARLVPSGPNSMTRISLQLHHWKFEA